MAAITVRDTRTSSSNSGDYGAGGSFTPAAGELLVSIAFASATVANPAVLVASANGITFTQRHYHLRGTTDSPIYLLVANQLVGGSPVSR